MARLAPAALGYSALWMGDKNATQVLLADDAGIARAASVLSAGGLVAVPTETVYGLAARADSADAVARIFAAKGRPAHNPLIVHVRDLAQAEQYGEFTGDARVLAEKEWPAPLTLVVPRRVDANLADAVTAGLPTVAMRAPDHPVMRALLAAVHFPLAAPSANRSGFISPTTADHVQASLDGRINLVLDGGACADGLESTILRVAADGAWHELRPGPNNLRLLHALHFNPHDPPRIILGSDGEAIEAPGQLASHYAPGKPVRLNADHAEADEFMIGFAAIKGDCTLSASGDLNQAAERLYACLHKAARAPEPRIAIAPVPNEGIGRAINDRLRRAATPAD